LIFNYHYKILGTENAQLIDFQNA